MNIPTEPVNAVNGAVNNRARTLNTPPIDMNTPPCPVNADSIAVNASGCPVNTRPAPALDQSTRTEQYETEGQAA